VPLPTFRPPGTIGISVPGAPVEGAVEREQVVQEPMGRRRRHVRSRLPRRRDRRKPAQGRPAIRNGIRRAGRTLRIDWFEVTEIRGHVQDGDVDDWQVGIKVGFRIEGEGAPARRGPGS
jgi:flavin-binding protein dodecin